MFFRGNVFLTHVMYYIHNVIALSANGYFTLFGENYVASSSLSISSLSLINDTLTPDQMRSLMNSQPGKCCCQVT